MNDILWTMGRMWGTRADIPVDIMVSIAMYVNNTEYALYHTDQAVRYNIKSVLQDMLQMQQDIPPRFKRRKLN